MSKKTAKKTRATKTTPKLDLAPSVHHRHVMDVTPPAMRFTGAEDVKAWQTKLRRKVRQLIGRRPTERPPLNPRTLWRRDHELGTIEKIAFTSEPKCDVVAYVCLPKHATPPYPFMICLQGHSTGMHNSIAVDFDTETKPIEVEGDRDFGLGAMRRGVAALCIEQRSFGYRGETVQKAVSPHMCHDAVCHALKLGRTLCGERVHDVERGLEYLRARGDADMSRVGCMGNSGGGTVTTYAAALLPGIRFAMPSCSFCTFRDSIMSIYHCADNYIPGLFPYAEMGDVMGLFAPRPLVVVAGKTDPIFPVAAVRREFKHLKSIYEAAGAADNCRLVVGPEGHRFYADLAWPKLLRMLGASWT